MEHVGGGREGLDGLDGAFAGEDSGAELGDFGDGFELGQDVGPSGPRGDVADGDLELLGDGVEALLRVKEEGEEFGLVVGIDGEAVGVAGFLE
ncbi:MAG: hypothetical protein K2W85_12005 [Phycisphaerales bacterium]|nr:hypothetical protein [Phycisphaerales bacterium]